MSSRADASASPAKRRKISKYLSSSVDRDFHRYQWYMKHGPVFYLYQVGNVGDPLPVQVQRQDWSEDATVISFLCTLNRTPSELGKHLNDAEWMAHPSMDPFCICKVNKATIMCCEGSYFFERRVSEAHPTSKALTLHVPPPNVRKDYVFRERAHERTKLESTDLPKTLVDLVHDYLSAAWDAELD
jgi:hypothetical protein